MNSSNIIEVKEQYITPKVLPREQAACWLKWNKDAKFDKIILRYEADIDIFRLFNIDEEIFSTKENWNGKVEIPISMVQLDGFFGFTAYYTVIPESEREVSYSIDFVKGNSTQTFSFVNKITIPHIIIKKSTYDQIVLSNISPPPPPLSFEIKGDENTSIKDLSLTIDVISKNLKVKSTIREQNLDFVKKLSKIQDIEISGKGHGLIRILANYVDDLNNKYSKIIQEIPIVVETEQQQTIPIAHTMINKEIEFITAS